MKIKNLRLFVLVVAFLMVAAACGSTDDEEAGGDSGSAIEDETDGDSGSAIEDETDGDSGSAIEDQPPAPPECGITDFGDEIGAKTVLHLISVPPDDLDLEEGDDQFAELVTVLNDLNGQLVVSDETPIPAVAQQTIELLTLIETVYPGLSEILEDSDSWLERFNEGEARLSTIYLPDENAEIAVQGLRDIGIRANPVHVVFPSNHIGAYPGSAPYLCTWADRPPLPEATDGEWIVGVVDTAPVAGRNGDKYSDNKHLSEAEDCVASHGEFVADVIRQVNPNASIHHRNPFTSFDGFGWNCWRSDGFAIRVVTATLPLAELDALNFSFGAAFEPVLDDPASDELTQLKVAVETALDANSNLLIYAAAGNRVVPGRVYPAAFDQVIGVAAASQDGEWVLWTEPADGTDRPTTSKEPISGDSEKAEQMRDFGNGPVVADWIDVYAPGCDLIADATGVTDQVVRWSGSSFATAVAAALGTPPPADGRFAVVGYDELPPSAWAEPLDELESQCG
ncbi:MAG: S8/S53 family peptidase [Actinomycetota bacterium]